MELHKPRYKDPFNPVLINPLSVSLPVSQEQLTAIQEVLEKCCSDTQFAAKAYKAIWYILTVGVTKTPVVSSLNPPSVVLGSPTFDIRVIGSNFTPTSKIIFNGFEEPTTFVNTGEIKTGVNMDVWAAPAVVPISVDNAGIISNSMNFEFMAVVGTLSADKIVDKIKEHKIHDIAVDKIEEHKKEVVKEHVMKDDHPLNPLKK